MDRGCPTLDLEQLLEDLTHQFGEDAAQDAILRMLEKGAAIAGKEREYTHKTARFTAMRTWRRGVRDGRMGGIDGGNTAAPQNRQVEARQLLEWLSGCESGRRLIEEELGGIPLSNSNRYYHRRKARLHIEGAASERVEEDTQRAVSAAHS